MNKITIVLLLVSVLGFGQRKTQERRQHELDVKRGLVKETESEKIKDSINYPVKFCLIVATGKMLSNKVDISIDYGQNRSFFENTVVRDEHGKVINFNSVVDALNYMNSLG